MKLTTALMWVIVLATAGQPVVARGQATDEGRPQSAAPTRPPAPLPSQASSQNISDFGSTNYPIPQITVMAQPPAPAQWPLHDRLAWAANLVLALVGYGGIWVALRALKRIERQTTAVEAAVAAVAAIADTALQHSRAMFRAERPWITITAEPSPDAENTSIVVATNRGRGPARVVAMVDRIISAIDEAHLPEHPEYGHGQKGTALGSMILLPGESTAIRTFGPKDVEQFCDAETLKRLNEWSEKMFIYGKVTYKDLNAPDDNQVHETAWCCWYIYGQKKSGLVTTGVPAFTVLT